MERDTKIFLFGSIALGMIVSYYTVDKYLSSREPILQQQVIGGEKPDIYIERSGARYFSHIDAKEISDLVK